MPSTVIDRFTYDAAHEILTVVFQSGSVYQYKNVPKNVYLTLKGARSKGGYLNKYIKGVYEYENIEEADH